MLRGKARNKIPFILADYKTPGIGPEFFFAPWKKYPAETIAFSHMAGYTSYRRLFF